MLGLAPLLVGNALGLSVANSYYAFPAVPWVALLVAATVARLPGRGLAGVMAALVAWNVLALAVTRGGRRRG